MSENKEAPAKRGRPFKYEGGAHWRMYAPPQRSFKVTELNEAGAVVTSITGPRLAALAPSFGLSVKKLYSISERNKDKRIKVQKLFGGKPKKLNV